MGARGLSRVERVFLGSVSIAIVARAHWSVEVMRSRWDNNAAIVRSKSLQEASSAKKETQCLDSEKDWMKYRPRVTGRPGSRRYRTGIEYVAAFAKGCSMSTE